MINLTLYGKHSSNYEYLKSQVLDIAKDAGIKLRLREIKDVNAFVSKSLTRIPSIEINNRLVINNVDIDAYLQEVNLVLLKEKEKESEAIKNLNVQTRKY
ncbi:hypothetical protein N9L92_00245 [Saprospiraceae bacterium]|nr:hypothetical protein [Saprospiraceae bacterium]